MAKFGKVDYKALQKLQERLQQFDSLDRQKICKDSAQALGQSLYKRAKDKTITGTYPKSSGKVGGTLKRGWKIEEADRPGGYQVDVFNDVEYAAYVEWGHRTVNHKKWVSGQYMLTRSVNEVEAIKDKIVNKHVGRALRGLFDDK